MSPNASTHALVEEGAPTTRCRILATAADSFREIGYQKTTVADIARALKMSPTNVYRFFDSKKAINEAVLERLIGEIESTLTRTADRPELTAAERLALAIEQLHRQNMQRHRDFPRLHEMVEAGMDESWEVCCHHVARITAAFERIIRDGVVSGEFDVPDPALAAGCVHVGILRYAHPLFVGQPIPPHMPPLRAMIAFLLRSLTPTGG